MVRSIRCASFELFSEAIGAQFSPNSMFYYFRLALEAAGPGGRRLEGRTDLLIVSLRLDDRAPPGASWTAAL